MDSRVTVLIPNFNGEKFLPRLFDCLVAQTLTNFKCVFLDDGSTDDSIEVARSYQKYLLNLEVLELSNVGIARNWNRGIEQVTTEFFTLLHCDDAYEPEYLAEMIKLMDHYPGAALGHCGAVTMNERGQSVYSSIEAFKQGRYFPARAFCRSIKEEYQALLSGDFINCPSVIYRASMTKEVGFFNVHLTQTLDWEYWFRVLLNGFSICGTSRRLYRYRRHENNLSKQNAKDMSRYMEELKTLKWAHAEGTETGLVDSALNLSIVTSIMVYDIGVALDNDDRAAAKQKLEFMVQQELLPEHLAYVLRIIIYSGYIGGWLLLKSVEAVVMCLSLRLKFVSWYSRIV